MSQLYLWKTDGALFLKTTIQAQAKRTCILGPYADTLKIAVSATPVDGKANRALIKYLAGLIGIPKSAISIEQGAGSRQKLLKIDGIAIEQCLEALETESADA